MTVKKIYQISELDCAVCADALEKKINTVRGVKSAKVSYFLQQLTLEADDAQFEDILKRVRCAVDHSVPGAVLE
jgi:copper chaperone CopZ